MNEPKNSIIPRSLRAELMQDELYGLSFYRRLETITRGDLRLLLQELVQIEAKHLKFWEEFFGESAPRLSLKKRITLTFLFFICRMGGETIIRLVLEAIEIYGIRKYLFVARIYQGKLLAPAVEGILRDELEHEEKIVSGLRGRTMNSEKVRNIILGFNDGLVEIMGALGGFFAAFDNNTFILFGGFTVSIAGSLSMAAGSFAASSSEAEVRESEREKKSFFHSASPQDQDNESSRKHHSSLASAVLVGISYFIGAILPVLPVIFGARSLFLPFLVGVGMVILISLILSFLSGMEAKRRIAVNLIIIVSAVGVTYALGKGAKLLFGISL